MVVKIVSPNSKKVDLLSSWHSVVLVSFWRILEYTKEQSFFHEQHVPHNFRPRSNQPGLIDRRNLKIVGDFAVYF